MRFELLVLACLGPFVTLEAKKLPVLPPAHPYVMSIELIFNEDNIIEFITESLFATISENLDENKNCNITLFDVLSILPAENLTPAVNELNITLRGDDVTQLIRGLNYSELAVTGLSAKKVYRNLVNAYFQNATQDLLSCLNILDITAEFTTAYAFGTDEELFQAFQRGNFSVYNLQEIAAIVNTPLVGISKLLGIKHFDTPYIKNVINNNLTELLVARGLNAEGFRKFLEAFELEVDNFKKIKSFKNFYKIRTDEESLGMAVGPNEVITNDNSIIESLINLEKYVSLKIRSLQNSKIKYLVGADKVQVEEEGIFTIHVEEDLLNYINKTKNYQGILTKNCTYVTQDIKHRLIARNVSVNVVETKLAIPKLFGTVFKRGSPLICESLLYGLAEVDNIDSITFTKVGEENRVATNIDSSAFNGLFDLLTSLLQLFDVCSHTDCKPHGVNTAQSETQTQSELEAQNQLENEAQDQSGNEGQTQSEVQAQNEPENEESSQFEVEVQLETEAQNQSINDAKSQAEVHAQNENETHFQFGAEAQNQSENEAQSQAEIQSEIEAQNQSENEPEVQTQTQNENGIQAQSETEAQNQSSETKSKPEAETQSVTEAQIQSETQEQNQLGNEGELKTETQSEIEIQFETEIQTDAEIQTDSDVQFPTEAETGNLDVVA